MKVYTKNRGLGASIEGGERGTIGEGRCKRIRKVYRVSWKLRKWTVSAPTMDLIRNDVFNQLGILVDLDLRSHFTLLHLLEVCGPKVILTPRLAL